MKARITPRDRPGFVIEVMDCTYTDSINGGYKDASFTIDGPLDEDTRARMLDAEVVLLGPNRPVWAGRIYSYDKGRVACSGWQECMTRDFRASCYVFRSDQWKRMESARENRPDGAEVSFTQVDHFARDSEFTKDIELTYLVTSRPMGGPQLQIWYADLGLSCSATLKAYYWRTDSSGGDQYGTCSSHIGSWSNLPISVTSSAADLTGLAWSSQSGSDVPPATMYNMTSREISVQMDGARYIYFALEPYSGYFLFSNPYYHSLKFHELYQHGIFGEGLTPTGDNNFLTVSEIMLDVLTHLPGCALPSGSAYLAWVEDDQTSVSHFVHDQATTEATRANQLCALTDKHLMWRVKLVGGEWHCVPVFRSQSTSADLVAKVGPLITCNLTASTLDTLATTVLASYTNAEGNTDFLEVTDTDPKSYLNRIGATRSVYIDTDARSATDAQASASAHLAQVNTASSTSGLPVTGSVTVNQPLGTTLPCEIEAGQLLRITGTMYGDVTALIREVSHQGAGSATLTLDTVSDVADRLRIMLARKNSRLVAT